MLSIITASYNSEKTITKTIESLLNQTNNNFEYIIIDGASVDGTVDIIKSFEDDFKCKGISFRWISQSDTGIYDAWNKGLKMVSGNWVSFIGSDDYYKENAIEIYSFHINKKQTLNIDFVYSNVELVKDGIKIKEINGIWSWEVFKNHMNIAHVGAFHNVEYFKKFGNFNSNYKIAGDYELLLRATKNLKTLKINQFTAVMDADGVSNTNIKKVLNETFKAKNITAKIGSIKCSYDYIIAYLKYFIKKVVN